MSAHSTPERATGSDNEMSDVGGNGKLNDPTGQYASAYARAGKAIQAPSSQTPERHPSSQQPNRERHYQSGSRIPSPTLDSILASGLLRRQIEQDRRNSLDHISTPTFGSPALRSSQLHRQQERGYSQNRSRHDTSSEATVEYQTPAVSRVLSSHPPPSQKSMNIHTDMRPPTSHSQHHQSSPQYNFSDFELSPPPIQNRGASHRSRPTPHYTISEFEQSPRGLRTSLRQQPLSAGYEDIEYEDLWSSRELVPYYSDYAEEARAKMNEKGQPAGIGSNESIEDDDDSDLFVQGSHSRSYRVEKSGRKPNHRFSHDSFTKLDTVDVRRPGQLPSDEYYNNPGRSLAPSRYAGGELNWGINQIPVLVPQELVTDAALLKRGLKRGKEDKVCKRGYGANDPENIAIVNMYEKDSMSFEQIKNKLNADRIETGRTPSLTSNGCHSRYNRTAPILFASEGRGFTPLSQRARGERMDVIPTGGPKWNDHLDTALVRAVKEWEATKWGEVARIFQENTGVDIPPDACAHRHTVL